MGKIFRSACLLRVSSPEVLTIESKMKSGVRKESSTPLQKAKALEQQKTKATKSVNHICKGDRVVFGDDEEGPRLELKTLCGTYAMRFVSPCHRLEQFFIGHKCLESRIVWFRALSNLRAPMFPGAILCARKELLQQFVLGAHVNVNNAITQSELITTHEALVEGSLCIALREKLNVAIHGLSRRSIHDDMYGNAIFGGDDFRVTSEETEDFLFGQGIGDLQASHFY